MIIMVLYVYNKMKILKMKNCFNNLKLNFQVGFVFLLRFIYFYVEIFLED